MLQGFTTRYDQQRDILRQAGITITPYLLFGTPYGLLRTAD